MRTILSLLGVSLILLFVNVQAQSDGSCTYNGVSYENGRTWEVGTENCITCSCSDGEYTCSFQTHPCADSTTDPPNTIPPTDAPTVPATTSTEAPTTQSTTQSTTESTTQSTTESTTQAPTSTQSTTQSATESTTPAPTTGSTSSTAAPTTGSTSSTAAPTTSSTSSTEAPSTSSTDEPITTSSTPQPSTPGAPTQPPGGSSTGVAEPGSCPAAWPEVNCAFSPCFNNTCGLRGCFSDNCGDCHGRCICTATSQCPGSQICHDPGYSNGIRMCWTIAELQQKNMTIPASELNGASSVNLSRTIVQGLTLFLSATLLIASPVLIL